MQGPKISFAVADVNTEKFVQTRDNSLVFYEKLEIPSTINNLILTSIIVW